MLPGSIEALAKRTGISTKTIYRRLQKPEFQAIYKKRRDSQLTLSMGMLDALHSSAVIALNNVLAKGSMSEKTRAANIVLNHTLRGRQHLELSMQIEELQSRIDELESDRTQRKTDTDTYVIKPVVNTVSDEEAAWAEGDHE